VLEHKPLQRGAALSHKTPTYVPADQPLRCLRDNLVVEPLDAVMSAIIDVIHETKPIRGIIRAAGPGTYPKKYDHQDKSKRTKMWDSKVFRPTQVKVGQTVELGGREHGGFAFQSFYWGAKLMIFVREEDVLGVVA
jgi:hypothetical protein